MDVMALTHFSRRSLAAMPWKNGGGTTQEIACWPPGAGLSEFGWRVSIATIAAPGPFSVFADIDRSIMLLEGEGHEVKTATDGVAGLALAREYRPEYLLLDIGLPRLSGYDIASSLRADPAMKDTTIVAITGYGRVHDKARSAAVGFDHHLTKPVEFTALQELLRARR